MGSHGSWWLHQPNWKICWSKWLHLTHFFNNKKLKPPPTYGWFIIMGLTLGFLDWEPEIKVMTFWVHAFVLEKNTHTHNLEEKHDLHHKRWVCHASSPESVNFFWQEVGATNHISCAQPYPKCLGKTSLNKDTPQQTPQQTFFLQFRKGVFLTP